MQDAGPALLEQALAAAHEPETRRAGAAQVARLAVGPGIDQVEGQVVVGLGGGQEVGVHRHPGRHPEQRERAHPLRVAGRAVERDQRPHGVAGQGGLGDPGRVQQADHPVGQLADRAERGALGAAVARQVERQDAAAPVSEEPGLQRPDRVVHPGAVDEDEAGQGRVEGPPAGRREDPAAVDL